MAYINPEGFSSTNANMLFNVAKLLGQGPDELAKLATDSGAAKPKQGAGIEKLLELLTLLSVPENPQQQQPATPGPTPLTSMPSSGQIGQLLQQMMQVPQASGPSLGDLLGG